MRRAIVLLCSFAVAAGLWLAAPALSLDPAPPRAVDFTLAVPTPPPAPVARAADRDEHGHEHEHDEDPAARWTSPVLRAPRRFDVLGLKWRSAAGPGHAEVRVRARGGRWSAWTEAPVGDDHAGDGRPRVRGTDPVWAGGKDELQLRLARPVAGLRVHFVNATGTATPAARRLTAARAALAGVIRWAFAPGIAGAAGEQPAIVPRAEWGGDECAPRDAPQTGQVQMAFVHHTVGTNDYTPEQSPAIVLGICRYHRNANGWDDVGYNFLVDKYGTIFEGRAGGIDQAVVGAQAQGYNAVSTGVANLGTYQDAPQSDVAVEAIARLVAWKLPLHGVPVTGTVTVQSAGGSANRHPKGAPVTFERISGHRDGNATECPGAALYAQLPRLRELAAARAPAIGTPTPPPAAVRAPVPRTITLTAATRRLAFPAPARLAGRMADAAGGPVPAAPVALQLLTADGFRTVQRLRTGPDGTFTAEVPTARNRAIRAIRDVQGRGRIASRTVPVSVAPALTAAAPRRVRAGRRLVVTGTVAPRKGSVVVSAARQGRTGGFAVPVRLRVRTVDGRYRAPVRLDAPGVYRVRVAYAGDRVNAPSRAPDLYARATRGPVSGGATAAPAG